MKNALSYYYNLNPINIHQKNKTYKFEYQNNKYYLLRVDNELKEINQIYNLVINLNNKGIYINQIIPNIQNQIVTNINNTNYILMKSYGNLETKITIEDIINFSNQTTNVDNLDFIRRDNWYELWTKKIDYFEYQVNQLGKKFPLIRESFGYFVGMAENGISLLINLNIKNNNLCLAHKRIKENDTLFDLYNPLNFIIDLRVRDIAEYIKDKFYNNEDPIYIINDYIKYNNLTSDELKLLFIRLIYPSNYFDLYEKVIEGEEEEILYKVIDKVDEYEQFLKKTYYIISNYIELPDIEWIKKT